MIRAFRATDLQVVMQLWLEANVQAHDFIPRAYWEEHFDMVRDMLPKAEVYVHEDGHTRQIDGFIGLTGDFVAGIFVSAPVRSRGIGRRLLRRAKEIRPRLELNVYRSNERAVRFYRREGFEIQSEGVDERTQEREWTMVWSKRMASD